jgi:hypothetical protein
MGLDNPVRQQSGPVRTGKRAQIFPSSATYLTTIASQASQGRVAFGLQAQAEQKAPLLGVQFVEPESSPFPHAASLPQSGEDHPVVLPGQFTWAVNCGPSASDVVCLPASHEQFRP